MSGLSSIRRVNDVVKLASRVKANLVLPERLKGGRIERMVNYGKNVLTDYRQAIQDIYTDSLQNKPKALTYFGLVGLLTYLYKTNPHPSSFKNEVISYQNLMALISEPIRNSNCYGYLHELNTLDNQRRLHRINLIFLTVLVREEFSANLSVFEANCKYLQPSYLDYLTNRIVDIGIANKWILLDRNLKDFDINPDEWK